MHSFLHKPRQKAPAADADSAVLFDEASARRLSEIYAPCFTLALQLRSTREFGDAEVLRRRIRQLLDNAEQEASRAGVSSQDVELATFALVALLDETILSSDWNEKDRWLAKPLQLERYNRYDAGEEFFVRLENLRGQAAAHAEVIEVYYLCLALGFKGRYLLQEQEKLRSIIEGSYAQLRGLPGMTAKRLSPHGRPRDQVATEVKSKVPAWALAVAAAVIGVGVYVGMHVYIDHSATQVAQTIEQIQQGNTGR
ncbi:MAG TPA: type IVB secretion system protein IcmH/DotU [Rhodothermales bacterium]|nr:type IVB secretion system protein IcmH/DotU [Rhodothermales bacterium]